MEEKHIIEDIFITPDLDPSGMVKVAYKANGIDGWRNIYMSATYARRMAADLLATAGVADHRKQGWR